MCKMNYPEIARVSQSCGGPEGDTSTSVSGLSLYALTDLKFLGFPLLVNYLPRPMGTSPVRGPCMCKKKRKMAYFCEVECLAYQSSHSVLHKHTHRPLRKARDKKQSKKTH